MDSVLPTILRYRWELLPLLTALAVGNLGWLRPFFVPSPFDPFFPEGFNRSREFFFFANLTAALVLGAGLLWSLWREQTMAAGLWAIVFAHPLVIAALYLDGMYLGLLVSMTGGAASVTQGLLVNVALQLPSVLLVAFLAWRLGDLGLRHAMLIAAGYLAWRYMPMTRPWTLSPFAEDFAQLLAWVGLFLWTAKFAALAFAFHNFLDWDGHRQRLAAFGLAMLPLVVLVLGFIPQMIGDLRLGRFDPFAWPPDQVYFLVFVLPTVIGLLVLALTWLLSTRWPASRNAEVTAVED